MKNKKIKIILTATLLGLAYMLIPNKINASGLLSISSAPSSVQPGSSFSVTISAQTGCGGYVIPSVSNGSYNGGKVWVEAGSPATITCTAGNSGSCNVSVSGTISDGDKDNQESTSKSVQIGSTSQNSGSQTSGSTSNGSSASTSNTNNNTSSTAKLTGLKVDGQKVTVSNSMSMTVPYSKSSVNVAAAGNGNCSVICKGINNNNVNLDSGSNKISITVNSNGQTKTYTLNVIRLAEESNIANVDDTVVDDSNSLVTEENEESSDLKLTSLNVKNFNLNPEFSPDVYEYTLDVDMDKNDISALDLEALAADGIDVKVIGNENLIEGENVITIILKKGEEQTVYQIIVNKIKSSSETEGMAEKAKNAILGLDTPKKIGIGAGALVIIGGISTAIITGRKKTKEMEIMQEVTDDEENLSENSNNIDENIEEYENNGIINDEDLDTNMDKEEKDYEQYKNIANQYSTKNDFMDFKDENKNENKNEVKVNNGFDNNIEKVGYRESVNSIKTKRNKKGKHSM